MLGLTDMMALTHAMEDILDKVRRHQFDVTPELIDALLASIDGLKALKDAIGATDAPVDVQPLIEAIRLAGGAEANAAATTARVSLESIIAGDIDLTERVNAARESGTRLARVLVRVSADSPWASVRLFQAVQELGAFGEIYVTVPTLEEIEQEQGGRELELLMSYGEHANARRLTDIRDAVLRIDDVEHAAADAWGEIATAPAGEDAATPGDAAASAKVDAGQTVRIDVERLDSMMNLVGELIIDRTRVNQISGALRARYRGDETVHALEEIAAHIGKMVQELNESMLQARMLPMGVIFGKFPRLVRDVARATGKDVDFTTEGEDTEIDRTIIEKIKDPLMHLVRNAVDHGLESPDTRIGLGKPRAGAVRLSAHHEQGHIVITLQDDGKGIDAAHLKESAVAKGLITAEAAERLSQAEAIDLIFEPGFSTAKQTSDISGRGVGMDVVRKSIQSLNGSISVETEIGRGTTFRLQLPLTLTTFRGLLVKSGDSVYAIPLSYVQETVRLDQALLETIVDREVVNLRGTVMPVYRLSEFRLQVEGGVDEREGNHEAFVVVVKVGERLIALAVDGLVDQQEIVVKSMGKHVGRARGVAGASILGDGQVALILDVASLSKAA
jgi:two-component system chemotaxis sensor kinase CheA